MKNLKEALITKKSIKNIVNYNNRFGITKKDLINDISEFPIGVVVRMLEEQEKQGNKPNIEIFQTDKNADSDHYGFYWDETEDGIRFWNAVIMGSKFDKFYERYPEYKIYDAR